MTSTDWRRLYPFASHELLLNNSRYHYIDEGQGRPLLFVHGNPTWSFYWRNLIQPLRQQFRCLAVDHMGCGLSEKPANFNYRLTSHIENLATLMERLDLTNVTLLVHDWGGAIGLGAALQAPHRVQQLVLFNTGAFPPPFVPWRIAVCRTPLFGEVAVRGLNLFARAALCMAVAYPERMTPEVRSALLAPYDSWTNRIAIQRFVDDIPFTRRHPTWQVLERIERELITLSHLPTLVFWGMKDWCFRSCLERLLQSFPHAEVHRLEDASHYVVEDAHERIVPILQRFLSRTTNS